MAIKALFNVLSRSSSMRRLLAGGGRGRILGAPARMARRFIAGETLDEAVAAALDLKERGISATLNNLGEAVDSPEDARRAAKEYAAIVERLGREGLDATVSVKPTHLGLAFGEDLFREGMEEILRAAAAAGKDVEIDMEDSGTTEAVLRVYLSLLGKAPRLRVALQAALRRTARDLEEIVSRGGAVRLVKGAYDEPAARAFRRRRDVDGNYARLIERSFAPGALEGGFRPAFGTHDGLLVEEAVRAAVERGASPDRFEFQMLFGVRRDLVKSLVDSGFPVRVYVPFGREWYPYFMRRLGERPRNVLFLLRALAGN